MVTNRVEGTQSTHFVFRGEGRWGLKERGGLFEIVAFEGGLNKAFAVYCIQIYLNINKRTFKLGIHSAAGWSGWSFSLFRNPKWISNSKAREEKRTLMQWGLVRPLARRREGRLVTSCPPVASLLRSRSGAPAARRCARGGPNVSRPGLPSACVGD